EENVLLAMTQQKGLCASFQARVCSRAPPPTTSIFIYLTPYSICLLVSLRDHSDEIGRRSNPGGEDWYPPHFPDCHIGYASSQ
ncbi:MAG: hypothetical protein Q8Q07_00215, partial [Dehalococcoidales bacterium]|nr:hypothetical protein [Dehalococcoidales bacterium]